MGQRVCARGRGPGGSGGRRRGPAPARAGRSGERGGRSRSRPALWSLVLSAPRWLRSAPARPGGASSPWPCSAPSSAAGPGGLSRSRARARTRARRRRRTRTGGTSTARRCCGTAPPPPPTSSCSSPRGGYPERRSAARLGPARRALLPASSPIDVAAGGGRARPGRRRGGKSRSRRPESQQPGRLPRGRQLGTRVQWHPGAAERRAGEGGLKPRVCPARASAAVRAVSGVSARPAVAAPSWWARGPAVHRHPAVSPRAGPVGVAGPPGGEGASGGWRGPWQLSLYLPRPCFTSFLKESV